MTTFVRCRLTPVSGLRVTRGSLCAEQVAKLRLLCERLFKIRGGEQVLVLKEEVRTPNASDS